MASLRISGVKTFNLCQAAVCRSAILRHSSESGKKSTPVASGVKKPATKSKVPKATPTVKAMPTAKATPKTAPSMSEAVDDNTKYQVLEYFAHTEYTFYDLDKSMAQFRLPQPSKYKL